MTHSRRDPGIASRLGTAVVVLSLAAIAGVPAHVAAQSLEPPFPTPVPVAGGTTSPSPFPSVLHTPPPTVEPPPIRAGSALLVDLETGRTLLSLDPSERRPIASLTKIMTAYLVLTHTSPTEVVTVSENAASGTVVGISTLGLVAGERIPVRSLLYALLLQSANDAAVALAEHVSGSVEAFVERMNRAARQLGLDRTSFASPNGLDDTGYSTARDLVRLTRAAVRVPGFADIVGTRTHSIPGPAGEPRVVQNRNVLLWLYPGATGVKTGFTTPAGFCVVATAERDGESLLAVVLGEPGEPFSDAAALMNYGFAAFERRPIADIGQRLGTVEIDGREVAVEAGASLEGLVPVGAEVVRRIEVDPGVRYPPGRGQAVGTVILSVPGRELGRIPLVVTDVPAPPRPQEDAAWWARAIGSVVDAGAALVDALLS